MSELKPCPFCGENPELQTVARDWYRLKHPHVVECPLDDLELTYPQADDQLEYLTGDWNRRAIPADQVLVPREALERCARSLTYMAVKIDAEWGSCMSEHELRQDEDPDVLLADELLALAKS